MFKYFFFFFLIPSLSLAQEPDIIWLATNDSTVRTIKQGHAIILFNKNNDVFLILLTNTPTDSKKPIPGPGPGPGPKVSSFKFIDPNLISKIVTPYLNENKITKDQISILSNIYNEAKSNIDTVNAGLPTNVTKKIAQDILVSATRDNFSSSLPAWKPILNQIGSSLGQINTKINTSSDLAECYGEIAKGLDQVIK